MQNFKVGQKIRVLNLINKAVSEGTIVDVKSDRVRAVPFGEKDNGIGFGFHFRAVNRACRVEII
jgi:hypothetical protein